MQSQTLTLVPNMGTAPTTPLDILSLFLRGRTPCTLAAYRTDMEDFTQFLNTHTHASSTNEAARAFLSSSPGNANRLVLEYRQALVSPPRSLSPASINRKLSTLRSLTSLARMLGMITWRLEIPNVPSSSYRDTRGPTPQTFSLILRQSERRTDPKGIRDQAITLLLHDVALRRGEVVSLDMQDVDVYNHTIAVTGKGRSRKEKTVMSLPSRTFAALASWIQVRGSDPGPLFTNMSRNPSVAHSRLTSTAVYQIIQKHGLSLSTPTHITPHGLRHTAITTAVERAQSSNVDLDKVRQFSRHAKLATLQIYADQHENWQGQVAEMVAK